MSRALSALGQDERVPRNLPETDPVTMTHTRLLNDGLRALRAGASD